MTNEEAIIDIRENIQPIIGGKSLELAISALEKQIPKKPLNPCGRYFGKAKGGNCPCCGAHTNSITNNYCRKCGRKLDWGDTE